jgi:hypothetical protein
VRLMHKASHILPELSWIGLSGLQAGSTAYSAAALRVDVVPIDRVIGVGLDGRLVQPSLQLHNPGVAASAGARSNLADTALAKVRYWKKSHHGAYRSVAELSP